MRVATRRLRAALEVFEPCFPSEALSGALDEVKALADALGERRDRDVAIAALERVRRRDAAPDRPGIESLIEELEPSRTRPTTALAAAGRAREPSALRLAAAIAAGSPAAARDAAGAASPASVAGPGERGVKAARSRSSTRRRRWPRTPPGSSRVRLDELRSFAPDALEPDALRDQHDMRIAAKRLRYVLEATGFCFGRPAETARRRARDLQDLLGEIHDCDVMLPRARTRTVESFASRTPRRSASGGRRRRPRPGAGRPRPRTGPPTAASRSSRSTCAPAASLLFDRFTELWAETEERGVWRLLTAPPIGRCPRRGGAARGRARRAGPPRPRGGGTAAGGGGRGGRAGGGGAARRLIQERGV